jgi:hypothetical protein
MLHFYEIMVAEHEAAGIAEFFSPTKGPKSRLDSIKWL